MFRLFYFFFLLLFSLLFILLWTFVPFFLLFLFWESSCYNVIRTDFADFLSSSVFLKFLSFPSSLLCCSFFFFSALVPFPYHYSTFLLFFVSFSLCVERFKAFIQPYDVTRLCRLRLSSVNRVPLEDISFVSATSQLQ